MITMWKFTPNEYVYQTDDKYLAKLMQRRKNYEQFSNGINCNYFAFITHKRDLQSAKRTLDYFIKKSVS